MIRLSPSLQRDVCNRAMHEGQRERACTASSAPLACLEPSAFLLIHVGRDDGDLKISEKAQLWQRRAVVARKSMSKDIPRPRKAEKRADKAWNTGADTAAQPESVQMVCGDSNCWPGAGLATEDPAAENVKNGSFRTTQGQHTEVQPGVFCSHLGDLHVQ